MIKFVAILTCQKTHPATSREKNEIKKMGEKNKWGRKKVKVNWIIYKIEHKKDDDDEVELHVLGCRLTY